MSQLTNILTDLQQGHKLTALDALQRHGCLRLAARINDLQRQGYPIHSEMIKVGKKKSVARYFLLNAQISLDFDR